MTISAKTALSPDSYTDLAKSGMEKELNVKIKTLHLEKTSKDVYEGIAETTMGKKYRVEVGDLPEIEKPKSVPGLIDFNKLNQPNLDEIRRLAMQPMSRASMHSSITTIIHAQTALSAYAAVSCNQILDLDCAMPCPR